MTEPDEEDPLAEATPGQKLILIFLMFGGAAVLVVVLSVLLALLFR